MAASSTHKYSMSAPGSSVITVRIGAAYIAFGPQGNVTPYIDHIAAGLIGFVEADFGNVETRAEITAAGLAAPPGALPMLSDPDNLRLQLVNTTHGLFDTIMPGGRVTPEPAALIPIGLDHIMLSVTDVDRSVAYYRKLFGAEESRDRNPRRVWFKLADTKLGLEAAPAGRSLAFRISPSRLAGFHRSLVTARLGNSVLALSLAVKKVPFDFATSTTFQSKSSLADG